MFFFSHFLLLQVIEDGSLFLFVGALLLVDILILSVWTGADSLITKLQNGTIEVNQDQVGW